MARMLLGVTAKTTPEEIKAAWRQASLLLHPDKHAASGPAAVTAATTQMALINEAYDVLRQAPSAQEPPRTPPRSQPPPHKPTPPPPTGPLLGCPICDQTQQVADTVSIYRCVRCASPLFRSQCDGCSRPANVWGVGSWRCTCGRTNSNREVTLR